MLDHLLQNLRRHRCNMSPQLSSLHNMNRMTNACDKHLSLDVIVPINPQNLLDHTHSNMPCIVQTSDERAHVPRPSLRSKQDLVRGEDESHVSLDPLLVQLSNCNEPVRGHRNLHDNIRCQRCQVMSFMKHSFGILAHNLQVHWSRYDPENLAHEFQESPVLLCNQGRIRRNAIQDPHISERLDRCNIGRIKKYLHPTIHLVRTIFLAVSIISLEVNPYFFISSGCSPDSPKVS